MYMSGGVVAAYEQDQEKRVNVHVAVTDVISLFWKEYTYE